MSQIGNIYNSFGKQLNIAIANTYSNNVLSGSNLPSNSIIIASNVDDNLEDTGTYSLIATDINGNPIRLTYTISEGNGLYYSKEDDALSLHIDNTTIINSQSGLKFNISSILSDEFNINGDDIYINMNAIPSASKTNYGIARIDNKTLKEDDGILYVVTANLNYANDITEQYGIGIGDNKTIVTSNGKVSLNLDSLNKASNTDYGIVKGDNNTVIIENGIVSINTENLLKANSDNYGISKPDDKTIIFDNKGNITINENNLPTATSSNYGVSKIDSTTLTINNGVISMKNYSEITSYITKYDNIIKNYQNKLDELTEYLSSGNILLKDNNIRLFSVNETSVAELVHPGYNEEVINMPLQTITAIFDVITTCDFILSININNDSNAYPSVDLLEVNYDEDKYDKQTALKQIYKSTEGAKKKLIIKFSARNFRNSKAAKYLVTSFDIAIANSDDHLKIKTQKYSIVRYNSYYNFAKEPLHKKEEKKKNKGQYVIDQNLIYWI